MKEEKSVSICPKCQKIDEVIKYGKRNNIQRYKCNRCKHVFPETRKRVKYPANEETLLALLVSLINSEKGNLTKTALKNVSDVLFQIEDYRLIEKQSTKNAIQQSNSHKQHPQTGGGKSIPRNTPRNRLSCERLVFLGISWSRRRLRRGGSALWLPCRVRK